MDYERALEIVAGVNAAAFIVMGFDEKTVPRWLEEVSLGDMIEAKRVVEERDANQKPAADGSKTFSIKPDDRLVSAVYTLLHFPAANEAVVADGRGRILAVLDQATACRRDEEDDDEDEAA